MSQLTLVIAYDYPKALEQGKTIPHWNIFGFEVKQVGYQGQVLPMLVATYILAKIEKGLRKAFIKSGCTKIIPNAAPRNAFAPKRFAALKPISMGNKVKGAFAKILIISARPLNV